MYLSVSVSVDSLELVGLGFGLRLIPLSESRYSKAFF